MSGENSKENTDSGTDSSNIDDTSKTGSDEASNHKNEEDITYKICVSKSTHKVTKIMM